MSSIDWLALLSLAISAGTPIAIFLARNWFKARIEKGVQHHFDVQIEAVRTDLRKSEERVKSDLRDKEAEITSLRQNILAGSAGRQSLLDKRRFEAVEKVWTAVNDLAQLKGLSGFMAILKYDAVSKESNDPKMQQFLKIMGASAPQDLETLKNVARDERPFLPELAWAYFSAYTSILYGALLRYKILTTGIEDPAKYINHDGMRNVLKVVLPHQEKWIDENDPGLYHYLLGEIESLLLTELRKILEGEQADQAATLRAKKIMDAIKDSDAQKLKGAAAQ